MAKYARPNSMKNDVVTADSVTKAKCSSAYFCATPSCPARMYLYGFGKSSVRFNSISCAEHISVSCLGADVTFNPHKYNEHSFVLDDFIHSLCSPERHFDTKDKGYSKCVINNAATTTIRTLKTFYTLCISRGLDSSYNEIPIRNIIVCRDNFKDYLSGFTGFRIVDVSFYRYDKPTNSIIFNCPPFTTSSRRTVKYVRAIFDKKHSVEDYYIKHRAYLKSHESPMAVAGVWRRNIEDTECICECCIMSPSKQIAYIG